MNPTHYCLDLQREDGIKDTLDGYRIGKDAKLTILSRNVAFTRVYTDTNGDKKYQGATFVVNMFGPLVYVESGNNMFSDEEVEDIIQRLMPFVVHCGQEAGATRTRRQRRRGRRTVQQRRSTIRKRMQRKH